MRLTNTRPILLPGFEFQFLENVVSLIYIVRQFVFFTPMWRLDREFSSKLNSFRNRGLDLRMFINDSPDLNHMQNYAMNFQNDKTHNRFSSENFQSIYKEFKHIFSSKSKLLRGDIDSFQLDTTIHISNTEIHEAFAHYDSSGNFVDRELIFKTIKLMRLLKMEIESKKLFSRCPREDVTFFKSS